MGRLSGGQIGYLTGLILRSSLSEEEQGSMLMGLQNTKQSEVEDLILHLEMHQLDITQLSNYTKTDINKRLDYLDFDENQ